MLLLSPDLSLDILHRPPVLLQLGADHPVLGLGLSLLGGIQRGLLPYEVLVLVLVVGLWCNLRVN